MIQVNNISKMYGNKIALDDISFSVDKGQILGLLGPNGAGKTTTMNIITGYISSNKGTVLINGCDILEEPMKARSMMGYLPEQPPLYLDMKVKDYLKFVYKIKKCSLPFDEHISEICELVGIKDVYGRIIKNLSKGYKQRVGFAQALIGYPEVIILDEPTSGFDPKQIIEIRELIKGFAKSHTVILSSHILSEIQAVCDRILVINKGKIVADDTSEQLSDSISKNKRYFARVKGDTKLTIEAVSSIAGVKSVDLQCERESGVYDYFIYSESDIDVREQIFKASYEQGLSVLELKSDQLSLEEIFLRLTGNEGGKDNVSDNEA